jgi:hypothetical protein
MRAGLSVLVAIVALLYAAPARAQDVSAVRLVECRPGAAQAERAVAFEGRMRAVRGAKRLRMRFTLQTRASEEETWRPVAAAGFDTWVTSARRARRHVHAARAEPASIYLFTV